MDKLTEFAQTNLTRTDFNRPEQVCDTLVRIVSRSSMVSMFEKPKFRDFVRALNSHEKEHLAFAFEKRRYGGGKRAGFEEILRMLAHHKIAKWPIISAMPFYFTPKMEAFVKPTTAKRIIAYLEIEEMQYRPGPSWEFYSAYVKLLNRVKREVHPSISPNYAALSGFLMSSL